MAEGDAQLIRPTLDMAMALGGVRVTQAGWKADPLRRHVLRYWDGRGWTGHVSDGDDTSWDDGDLTRLSSVSTEGAGESSAPGGSVAYAVIIWSIMVFLVYQVVGGLRVLVLDDMPLPIAGLYGFGAVVGVLAGTALAIAAVIHAYRVGARLSVRRKWLGLSLATLAVHATLYSAPRLSAGLRLLARGDVAWAIEYIGPGAGLLLVATVSGWIAIRQLKRR